MFRTPLHGDSSYHRGLRGSVTSRGENLAKETSIECERAEVLVPSICGRQRSLTPRGALSDQNVCHTCDGHQKGIDGLIVWRACEGRDTQHGDLSGTAVACASLSAQRLHPRHLTTPLETTKTDDSHRPFLLLSCLPLAAAQANEMSKSQRRLYRL